MLANRSFYSTSSNAHTPLTFSHRKPSITNGWPPNRFHDCWGEQSHAHSDNGVNCCPSPSCPRPRNHVRSEESIHQTSSRPQPFTCVWFTPKSFFWKTELRSKCASVEVASCLPYFIPKLYSFLRSILTIWSSTIFPGHPRSHSPLELGP